MARAVALPTITDDSALGGAVIERSLRFNRSDSAYLSKTFSAGGNRRTFTWSGWIKLSVSGNSGAFFSGNKSGTGFAKFMFRDDGRIELNTSEDSYSDSSQLRTTAKFRDPTSWYHVVVAYDTTQSTASDRVKLYINGEQITDFGTNTLPPQNHEVSINVDGEHQIGNQVGASNYHGGYMAEVHFIDGYGYDSSYFGFTEGQTGIWMPKRYEGTYGTTGFYLDFSDNSSTTTLGIDKSPNGNDFTLNNFSVAAWPDNDSVEDTPSNNWCTLNPLDKHTSAICVNGNLQSGTTATSGHYPLFSTMPVRGGKWYVEAKVLTNDGFIGSIMDIAHDKGSTNMDSTPGNSASDVNKVGYGLLTGDGRTTHNGSLASYGSRIHGDDIWMCAFDADNGEIYWGENGTFFNSGNPATRTNPAFTGISTTTSWTFAWHHYGSGNNVSVNFGQQGFSYTPPSGFKAINSKNLNEHDKTSPFVLRPQKHFGIVTWTGNGSVSGQVITGLEFEPDLLWIKERSGAEEWVINDTMRGDNKRLQFETPVDETNEDYVNNRFFGGFKVGNSGVTNGSSENNVAYCWKAGGHSNTYNIDGTGYASASDAGLNVGTITPSKASVNTESGLSILTYSGNQTAGATVAHGLGKPPKWIIIKSTSHGDNWMMYHGDTYRGVAGEDGAEHYYYEVNENNAANNDSRMMNDTAPTSTVFSLRADGSTNYNGRDFLAYCWAEIPGYSKFGYYGGNNNSDGRYVYCGFRPAFVTVKTSSTTNNYQTWDIKRDTQNECQRALELNDGGSDDDASSNTAIDFLSNGFKLRSSFTRNNGDHHFIFMAFADKPLTTPFDSYPNGR